MGVINRLNSVHSPATEFLHRETALRVMQAGDRLGKCWFLSMHLSYSPFHHVMTTIALLLVA